MNELVDTTEMYLRTIYDLEEEGVTPLRARIAERQRCYALDRKSTRLNSSHANISYAVFCLKKKKVKCRSADGWTTCPDRANRRQSSPATSELLPTGTATRFLVLLDKCVRLNRPGDAHADPS